MSDSLESLVRDNVKNNSFLFDKGHPDFINAKMKRETWHRIAFLIGEQEGIEINGDFVESLWLDMKGKYKRMIAALKNHNSGRNTAPENVDYIFIDAMKFAHDALENRPVQSSFARPISFRIEEHPAEFPSQRMLLREQLRNERQIATNNTIWGNPTRERRKVEFYETDLPPTVPPSDAFALAKQRRKRVLLDQLDHQYEKILDKMQKIDEKTEKNVCSSVFFNPIRNVLTNIDDSIKKVFYEDVTKIVEAYK